MKLTFESMVCYLMMMVEVQEGANDANGVARLNVSMCPVIL